MCNMQFFVVVSILLAVSIGSTSAIGGLLDGLASLFEQPSGCTVLVEVPLTPQDPYYKAEIFPSLTAKLNANQDRFDRDLHQVWVDAPDPSMCRPSYGGSFGGLFGGSLGSSRCTLNGHFESQYKWLIFRSGDKKKLANEQLWAESRNNGFPFYKVWADAPERYCKRQFGGLSDFLG